MSEINLEEVQHIKLNVEFILENYIDFLTYRYYVIEDYEKKIFISDRQIHRDDGPAVIYDYDGEVWYKHGVLHRVDGPAIDCKNEKEWYINGELHRVDGPAIENSNGTKEWYINGEPHRLDGPAIEDSNGTKEWYQNGELHRLDGPAIEWKSGDKEWYKNGKLHREDGPAIEIYHEFSRGCRRVIVFDNSTDKSKRIYHIKGTKSWWKNGEPHRLDGPAVENVYEEDEWWVEGTHYTENIVKFINKRRRKIEFKYFHIWYEKCDKPGTKIWDMNIKKGWDGIKKLYI